MDYYSAPKNAPLHSVEALLWVGESRIPGTFSVCEDSVEFRVERGFKSHISLYIPKNMIRLVEEFLLFGFSRNGLSIISQDGKEDLFIVEDPPALKRILQEWRHV